MANAGSSFGSKKKEITRRRGDVGGVVVARLDDVLVDADDGLAELELAVAEVAVVDAVVAVVVEAGAAVAALAARRHPLAVLDGTGGAAVVLRRQRQRRRHLQHVVSLHFISFLLPLAVSSTHRSLFRGIPDY